MTRATIPNHSVRRYGPRIQRNRRPSYAYVDPASLRPLNAMQIEYQHRNRAEAQRAASARARNYYTPLAKEDTTPHNVRNATTLMLLRMRARTVRAQYKRHWEVLKDLKPEQFVFKTPEVGDSVTADEQRLKEFIQSHLIRIEALRSEIERSESAKVRLNKVNRSGGSRHRMWEARNEAVVNELLWREMNPIATSARAKDTNSARAQIINETPPPPPDNSTILQTQRFPQQYAADNLRIADDMELDDLGLSRPTRKDRIKAAMVRAIDCRDYALARQHQDELDRMAEHERRVRNAKKARRKIIAQCRRKMDRPSEPNSGDEGNNGSAPA